MSLKQLKILLADDDADDCFFFKEALSALPLPIHLTTVNDGEQLMDLLTNETNELPHVLFLDINMPRKNGFECLTEIKLNKMFRQFTVIIFSTSFNMDYVNTLYQIGVHYFIRKPCEFSQYKKLIQQTFMALIAQENILQPDRKNFVLSS